MTTNHFHWKLNVICCSLHTTGCLRLTQNNGYRRHYFIISYRLSAMVTLNCLITLTHSLTAALDQLRVVASSTSIDPGPRSGQHQQIGQCLLPLVAANFFVDDPAGASSQQREECRCGLLLTVEVPAKQVCSPVGDRCVQITVTLN